MKEDEHLQKQKNWACPMYQQLVISTSAATPHLPNKENPLEFPQQSAYDTTCYMHISHYSIIVSNLMFISAISLACLFMFILIPVLHYVCMHYFILAIHFLFMLAIRLTCTCSCSACLSFHLILALSRTCIC